MSYEVIIGIPCMQKVDFYFMNSVLDMQRPRESAFCMLANSLVYDARDEIAEAAIKNDAKYILWLDSDMTFPPDTYFRLKERLENSNADMVSGLYFSRIMPYEPVIFTDIKLDMGFNIINKGRKYHDYPRDSFFEVDACGLGCFLIKTEAVRKVAEYYKGTVFEPLPKISEDVSFCQRAKKIGLKIYCDSTIKCGHIGWTIIKEDTYDMYNSLSQKNIEQAVADRIANNKEETSKANPNDISNTMLEMFKGMAGMSLPTVEGEENGITEGIREE